MLSTLVKILPLALTATISPTGLFFVMAILSSREENPRNKALVFLVGALLSLVTLGGAIMFLYKPAVSTSSHPSVLSGILDIFFGVLIILVIGRTILFPRPEKKEAEDKYRKRKKRPYVVLGYIYMITNVSTLIPFMAASKMLAEAELGFWRALPDFAVLLFVTMTLISLPVAVSYLMPQKAEVVLGPVKSFMSRHGRLLAQVLFTAIALYLIYEGIRKLTE